MPSPARAARRLLPTALGALSVALAAPAALPAGAPVGPPTAAAAERRPATKPRLTVQGELRKLRDAGSISTAEHAAWRTLYRDVVARAKAARKGTVRNELRGVLQNTETIAAGGALTPSLAPSVFLTLAVNREWWASRPVPPAWSRPLVPSSPLTWQYYPGEGLQIQWLATFGVANALTTTTTPAKAERLRAIEDEALRLASDRAGGPAWQYLFDFGRGKPPWASGMAQATAMQSLVRTSARLGEPRYREAAVAPVALLRRSAPAGARLKASAGDHLLLYTYSRMRVLNAFSQAVSALHEVAAATEDAKVDALYVRAERQLRRELPAYDLGDWARYSLGGAPETPSYHRVSRDNLRSLCRVLTADAGAFAAGRPVAGARPPAPAGPYCAMADRFAQDLLATPEGPRARTRSVSPGAEGAPAVPLPARDPAAAVADPALRQP